MKMCQVTVSMKVTAFLVTVDVIMCFWTECAYRTSPGHASHTVTNALRYVHFDASALLQYDTVPKRNWFLTFHTNKKPSYSRD
jgi:hypothetical protein